AAHGRAHELWGSPGSGARERSWAAKDPAEGGRGFSPGGMSLGGSERAMASRSMDFQASYLYWKRYSALSWSRDWSKSLATKARLAATRGGTRFWAMALKSLPRTKLMSVAVMKPPVREAASSEPRRSDSRSWRSARAWKTQSAGWSAWRNMRQARPSAKENWQRADSSRAARE